MKKKRKTAAHYHAHKPKRRKHKSPRVGAAPVVAVRGTRKFKSRTSKAGGFAKLGKMIAGGIAAVFAAEIINKALPTQPVVGPAVAAGVGATMANKNDYAAGAAVVGGAMVVGVIGNKLMGNSPKILGTPPVIAVRGSEKKNARVKAVKNGHTLQVL
jgi:hypothetical protein